MWRLIQKQHIQVRLLSLLVLCMFASHVVFQGLHHALVDHVTCLEHGEQLHHSHTSEQHAHKGTDKHHSHAHKKPVEEPKQDQPWLQQAPEQNHSHHVCGIFAETRKQFVLKVKTHTILSVPSLRPLLRKGAYTLWLIHSQPRYTLAPKQSPPQLT